MFRVLLRLAGLVSLAGAFAALVIDGTRSLAGGRIHFTALSELLGSRMGMLERSSLSLHPVLWDITSAISHAPTWLAFGVIGLCLW